MKHIYLTILLLVNYTSFSQELNDINILGNWRVKSVERNEKVKLKRIERQKIDSIKVEYSKSNFSFNSDGTCSFNFPILNSSSKNSFWYFNKDSQLITILENKIRENLVEERNCLLAIKIREVDSKTFFENKNCGFLIEMIKY